MYNYSGKGLFSNKPNLRDLKQKMDEAKNRTPEQKAEIKKASDEKRQQMRQQKKELLDENLQLASILAKKTGRTISRGAKTIDNIYKKVGIDVGMDKKLENASKAVSDLGKIGTRVLQGKGAMDKLRNDPKYQKLLEDVRRSGYQEISMKGGRGFADAIKKVQKEQAMTPAEKEEQARKQAEKKKKLAENVMTGIKLFDKGQQALNKFGQDKFNKAVDKYGLERIGIKRDTGQVGSIFDKKGSGFGNALKKIQKQQAMTPAEKEEEARKKAEKMQSRKEMAITGLKLLDKGTKMAVDYADNKINKAIDKYGLEKIGIKKMHHNLGSGEYGGFLPKEKQFFKVAKEEYKPDPPTYIDEFTLVYKSPTIHVYLNEAGKTILMSFRGTVPTDKDDLLADASIAINRLYYSNRFKKDKAEMQKIFQQYPPNQYEYYVTGHSLGGAITNSMFREYPKNLKYGVTYNPAFQPYDLYSQQRDKIKRLYTADDALYKLGGRFMNPTVVPTTKSKLPDLNLITTGFNAYQGHALDNFSSYYGMGMPMPKKRGRPRKMVGGCRMCDE